jgi:hypothetical protein
MDCTLATTNVADRKKRRGVQRLCSMRVVHSADSQECYECGARADVVVARGHRLWYACWEHANHLLEEGGVLVGSELE